MPDGEEGLGRLLVGGRSGTEAKARDDARGICGHVQREALVPAQTVGPSDFGQTGQPSRTSALCIPDGHSRAIQSFVRTSLGLHRVCQVQGCLLDEMEVVAHTEIERRVVGQGGEGIAQTAARVAVEIPFACEAEPPGEDGDGDDLAGTQGCIGTGMFFLWAGLAEVVHHDVECGEEGVLRSSMRSRFLICKGTTRQTRMRYVPTPLGVSQVERVR